jgi:hypothetical protein
LIRTYYQKYTKMVELPNDFYYNIITHIDDLKSLFSLFRTNNKMMKLFNDKNLLLCLSKNFNIHRPISTFQKFIRFVGMLYVPKGTDLINAKGTYVTHDNGGQPFRAEVDNMVCHIYDNTYADSADNSEENYEVGSWNRPEINSWNNSKKNDHLIQSFTYTYQ